MSDIDDVKDGLKQVSDGMIDLTKSINTQNIISENRTTKLETHVQNIYHDIKDIKTNVKKSVDDSTIAKVCAANAETKAEAAEEVAIEAKILACSKREKMSIGRLSAYITLFVGIAGILGTLAGVIINAIW